MHLFQKNSDIENVFHYNFEIKNKFQKFIKLKIESLIFMK